MHDVNHVEHARFGHAMADHKGIISAVDPVFCDQIGRHPADLIGCHILDITHPADRERNSAAVEQLLADQRPYQLDKHYLHADGSIVAIRTYVSLFRDGEQPPRLIAATERRRGGITRSINSDGRNRSVFDALDRLADLASVH